jgi:hypothetical protein
MRHTVLAVMALALFAAAGASAWPGRASQVIDRTYSCGVRAERYIDVNSNVTIPSSVTTTYTEQAQVWLDTAHKTAPVGGIQAVVPQVRFEATKNSLSVDRALCRPSSHHLALKPAGLPLYETVTRTHLGQIDVRCVAAKRVLVRFRITLTGGKPAHALVALRNDAGKGKPIEFLRWSPRRITGYLGRSCTDIPGPGPG